MKYIYAVLAIGMLLVAGYTLYTIQSTNKQLQVVGERLAKSQEELAQSNRTISELMLVQETLQESIQDVLESHSSITAKQQEIALEIDSKRLELEQYIGRTKTVIAKPKLVETKLNRSYQEFANEFECSTGVPCSK